MKLAHLGRSGLLSTRRLRNTLRLELRGRPKPEGNGSHAGCNRGRHGERDVSYTFRSNRTVSLAFLPVKRKDRIEKKKRPGPPETYF